MGIDISASCPSAPDLTAYTQTHTHAQFPNSILPLSLLQASPPVNMRPLESAHPQVLHWFQRKTAHTMPWRHPPFYSWTSSSFNCIYLSVNNNKVYLCSLSVQEMIIDKVDGQPVPRYLIYDIIKFNVSSLGCLRMCCLFVDPSFLEKLPDQAARQNKQTKEWK